MAKERVAKRVSKGGHNIPADVIERRYYRGIRNLVSLYIPLCDKWFVINNINTGSLVVARGFGSLEETIIKSDVWKVILDQANDN
jgi:predicted ABC-type ATPase